MKFTLLYISVFTLFSTLPYVAHGAVFTDMISGVLPNECKEVCSPWTSNLGGCVEKIGRVGMTIDPVVGGIEVIGDKLGLYLCLCNNEVKTFSTGCLTCISQKNCFIEPLSITNYGDMCLGKTDITTLINEKLSTANCTI